MQRIFAITNKVFLLVTGFFAAFMAIAFVLSVVSVPPQRSSCAQTTTVYLQYSLVHADFAMLVSDLSPDFRNEISLPVRPLYGEPEFMVFGLGDRDIYINTPSWGDLKVRYAAKALFLPTDRTLHVEPAYSVYEHWIPLELCPEQFNALENYIRDGFSRDGQGRVREMVGLTYSGYDRFYEAEGTYTMFNSCNNWANGGLKAAGLRAPIWSPFAQGVIYHARQHKPPAKVDP